MADVFDQLAPDQKAAPATGDVFDQVAAAAPDPTLRPRAEAAMRRATMGPGPLFKHDQPRIPQLTLGEPPVHAPDLGAQAMDQVTNAGRPDFRLTPAAPPAEPTVEAVNQSLYGPQQLTAQVPRIRPAAPAAPHVAVEPDVMDPSYRSGQPPTGVPGSFEGHPENVGHVMTDESLAAWLPDAVRSQAEKVPANTLFGKTVAPAGVSAAEFIASLAKPSNLATMGVLKMVPLTTPLGKAIHAAASAYFGVQMGAAGVEEGYSAVRAAQEGDTAGAVQHGTGAVFNTLMAGETTRGAGKAGDASIRQAASINEPNVVNPQEVTPSGRQGGEQTAINAPAAEPKVTAPNDLTHGEQGDVFDQLAPDQVRVAGQVVPRVIAGFDSKGRIAGDYGFNDGQPVPEPAAKTPQVEAPAEHGRSHELQHFEKAVGSGSLPGTRPAESPKAAPREVPVLDPQPEGAKWTPTPEQDVAFDQAGEAAKRGDWTAVEAARQEARRPELEPEWLQEKSTDEVYQRPDTKSWAPVRQQLHAKILDSFGFTSKPSKVQPTVVFTGGGAASGKSGVGAMVERSFPDAVKIDADEIKGQIPEYKLLQHSDPLGAAFRVHEESSYLSKRAIEEATANRNDIIIDSVSGNGKKVAAQMEAFKKAGYRVEAHFIDAPVDVAVKRMVGRFRKTGRWVPPDIQTQGHQDAAASYWRVKDTADVASLHDNSSRTGEPAELIHLRDNGVDKIYNQERVEQHQNKGRGGTNEAPQDGPGLRQELPGQLPQERGPALPGQAGRAQEAGAAAAAAAGAGGQTGAVAGQILRVPIGDITTNERDFQPREKLNPERVTAIAQNMRRRGAFGDSEPIDLWRDPKTGKLIVLSGHHRLAAAREAGLDTATVRIHDNMTRAEAQDFARQSNAKAAPLTAMEQARAFEAETNAGKSAQEIGQAYGGLNSTQVEDIRRLNKLAPELQRYVQDGVFDQQRAVVLARAAERYSIPPEVQKQAFDYVIKRREITAAQFGKLLDTFTPAAIQQSGFDFGAQAGFEGMAGFKGLADAMDEYNRKVKEVSTSQRRLQGFVREMERRERSGETLNRSLRGTKAQMEREVKKLTKQLKEMEESAGNGEVFKTLGSEIRKGQGADLDAEMRSPRAVELEKEPQVAAEDEIGADTGASHTQEMFAAKRRRAASQEPALPGFENVEAEREQVRGAEEGQRLTEELVRPPEEDVTRKTGEMETHSPLFRGSEASPQNEMFEPKVKAEAIDELNQPVEHDQRPNSAESTVKMMAEATRKLGGKSSFQIWERIGKAMVREPLTRSEQSEVRQAAKKMDTPAAMKDCFRNAQQLAAASDNIEYVEGFWNTADTAGIPIEHAWNLINGKVVDLTADVLEKKGKSGTRDHDYFGTVVPKEAMQEHQLDTEVYGPVTQSKYFQKFVDEYKASEAAGKAEPEVHHPQSTMFAGTAVMDPAAWAAVFPNARQWLRSKVGARDLNADELERGIVRQRRGELDRAKAVIYKALEGARDEWAARSKDDSVNFADAIERGDLSKLSAKDQAMATQLSGMLKQRRLDIQALGTGALENFIENYFPHAWEQPGKAKQVFQAMMGAKRPLKGPASFLKQRTIPTIQEGLDKGLTPLTYNPIEAVLLKAYEMDRFLMAHQIMADMKGNDLAQFVKLGDHAPEGWAKVNDSMFRVMQRVMTVDEKTGKQSPAFAIRGEYWAPKEAAAVLNNFLSPGLKGNAVYDAFRGASNVLNQAQLGFSAFHLGFTSIDAATSDMALAIEHASRGRLDKAVAPAARSLSFVGSTINNLRVGNQLMKEYLSPGAAKEYARIAQAIEAAGGRASMDPTYRNEAIRKFTTAKKEGSYGKALAQVVPAALEQMAKPIMEYIVPRQKLGVFHGMAADILERSDKGRWAPDKTRAELQKAWDSVDDRMGQVVYDNLFWNKVAKDLAMVSVRSVGWNFGSGRQIGGGIKDFATQGLKASIGEKPEVTHRMAYVMALPIIAGFYGALYQKIATGKGPEELKDFFYPKTGRLTDKGQPERVSLPTYMKDYYAFKHDPLQTVAHKVHPAVSASLQFLQNEDYYGTEIRHTADPAATQLKDSIKFALTQILPFSFRNAMQRRKTGGGIASTAQSFVGITPAPGYIVRSDAEEAVHQHYLDTLPKGGRTKEQAEQSQRRRDYVSELRSGAIKPGDVWAKVKAKELTVADAGAITRNAKQDSFVHEFGAINLPQALEAWAKMSPAEQQKMRPQLAKKQSQLEKYLPEQRDQLREKLQKALAHHGAEPQVKPPGA